MLLHKDLKGDSDLQENTALKAMLQVGNEFMTDRKTDSEVQRSGEFVTMRKDAVGTLLRWVGIWEMADGAQLDQNGDFEWLTDGQTPAPYGAEEFVARARFVLGEVEASDLAPLPMQGRTSAHPFRQPRNTAVVGRVVDVDNQAQQGRARLFGLGDGSLMLVQELADPADTRWLGGVDNAGMGLRHANRVAKVQVVRLQYDTQAGRFQRKTLLEFDVHSGLGFDPTGMMQHYSAPSAAVYSGTDLYLGNAGFMWGRLFEYSQATADQSGYYAVAEPAVALDGSKPYLQLVAVHGLPEDAYNTQTSSLYRLTCTYTTPNGVDTSKIAMPTRAGRSGEQYLAPYGLRLYRMGPSKLMLRAWVAPQRLSGTMADDEGMQVGELCWLTEDGGEHWSLIPQTAADAFAWGTKGSWVVRDSESCIKVMQPSTSSDSALESTTSCRVFEVTANGASMLGEIPMGLFNAGLNEGLASGVRKVFPDYEPVGEGGSVLIEGERHLWLQFDPVLRLRQDYLGNLTYPASRPMVLLTADGGATWQRLFLPSPWPHLVGFVQALDEKTLAVPVFTPRRTADGLGAVPVRLHVCKDAETWKPSKEKFKLPAYAWVDGQMGEAWESGQSNTVAHAFNRGELGPLVQLRDAKGDIAPINSARPWIANAQIEVPNGQ